MRWKNMINVAVVVATVAVAGLLIATAETVLATGVGGVSIGGGGGGGIGGGGVGVDGGGGGGGGGGRLRGAATATSTRQLQQKEEIDIDSDDESMRTPAAVQCASCSSHKEIKTLSIELIKMSILNKLGMQHPPEFGGRLPPPVPTDLPPLRAMLHDYNDRSSLPLPRIRHQMHHFEASGDGGSDMQSDEATGFAAAATATFASIDTYNSASSAGGGYSGGGGGGGGGGGYSNGYGDDDDDDDDYHIKTHKLIAYAQPHPTVQKVRNHNLLFFTFSDQTRQHRITEVILWVYKRRTDVVIDELVVQIDIYRVNMNTNHPILMNTVKRTINNTEPMWVPIDLHKRKSEWFRSADGAKNLTLSVHAYYASKNITHIRTPFVTDAKKKDDMAEIPYLEVHTREDRRSRARRNAAFELTCNETSVEPRCCRYPLTVDFEEFGWHWIIAPKKYVANYCSGLCDPTLFTKNPHAHLVQMTKLGKGPCCAPRKMSALSMLYYDNDYNIIYGLLPGMVVDRCGCS